MYCYKCFTIKYILDKNKMLNFFLKIKNVYIFTCIYMYPMTKKVVNMIEELFIMNLNSTPVDVSAYSVYRVCVNFYVRQSIV